MRGAAHHMVRFMTAGMALITSREPLLLSINTNLKTQFLQALGVSVTCHNHVLSQVITIVTFKFLLKIKVVETGWSCVVVRVIAARGNAGAEGHD